MKLPRLDATATLKVAAVLLLLIAAGAGGYALRDVKDRADLCRASYRMTCEYAVNRYGLQICAEALMHQAQLPEMLREMDKQLEEHEDLLREKGFVD